MVGSHRPRVLLSLLFLVLAGLLILACGSTTAVNSGQQVTGTVTSAPAPKHFKMGDQVKVGVWVVTINSATTSAGGEFDTPTGVYLVLDISFKNTDSSSHTVSSILQFTLQDSTGQKYNDTITSLPNVTAPDGDVQAGSLVRGQVVYDVGKDQHQFTWQFASILTPDVATWDITI